MKSLCFTIFYMAALVFPLRAEMQFPPYESLSPKEKEAWGYTVTKFIGQNYNNAMFRLVIPPHAAKLYQGSRLYFKDQQGKTLAEVNAGLSKAADGSLSSNIELFEGFGSATLIVYTNELPEAPFLRDMGGFSFVIPTKPKAEQAGADQPATAPELKSEGKDKPQPESKVRPR